MYVHHIHTCTWIYLDHPLLSSALCAHASTHFVYIHIYICIHAHGYIFWHCFHACGIFSTCTCLLLHVNICNPVYTCTYIHTHTYVHAYMYLKASLSLYVSSSASFNALIACMSICMYVCINICMHIFECMKVSCIYERACTRSACMSYSYLTSIMVFISCMSTCGTMNTCTHTHTYTYTQLVSMS